MSDQKTTRQILEDAITQRIEPLGYELVALQVFPSGQKRLQVFIDRLGRQPGDPASIGIEDCVAITKVLDEPLDQLPEVEKIFGGRYELEVSSPGVDRPLRKIQDFERFSGRLARIHVFRPLNADEIENPPYLDKNPRQKNFIGTLVGVRDSKVLINLQAAPEGLQVTIPVNLISKANLEPVFDFSSEKVEERKAKA